ncbi:MAG: hypothetical protein FWG31_00950 [Oscillospiraceae bacterium]|nr:hypothetical protein [Oscillospiraceae bacterium]
MDFDVILYGILFFLVGGGGITAIVMVLEVKKHRPVKMAADADMYIKAGETQMTVVEDAFLRTHTTKVKVASSNNTVKKR